jgi:hypothetical protein
LCPRGILYIPFPFGCKCTFIKEGFIIKINFASTIGKNMFNIRCVHPLEFKKNVFSLMVTPSILCTKLFGNGIGLDPLFQKIIWEFLKKCGKTKLLMFGCKYWINP